MKIQNQFILISLIFIITGLFSCNKTNECFKRPGEIDSIQYEVSDFKEIDIYNKFNVYLKQDTVNKVIIKGNKNIISSITTEVSDSILTIEDNNICNFTRTYDIQRDIYIHTKDLQIVFIYGPSQIFTIDTLKFEKLIFVVFGKVSYFDITAEAKHLFIEFWNCTGDYLIHGQGKYLHILNHGNSYIWAYDFESKLCIIEQRSTGSIQVSATEQIIADIHSIGNIYYKGDLWKLTIKENTSTGQVIKVED